MPTLENEDLAAQLAALARDNRILRAQLERSERDRRRLEDLKDRDESMLRQIIAELRAAQTEVERSNAILEQHVEERTRELSVTNASLTRARDAALAASRAKSSFLAVMSHELRTPLNAILGYAEILLDDAASGDDIDREGLAHDLGKIVASGQNLLSIINDLLDVSRVEAGATSVQLELISLRPLIREVEHTIRPLVRKQGSRLHVDVADAPVEVITDRTRLRQIVHQLLSNAAKFTRGGAVNLTVTEAPGALRLVVSDTGVGIPPEALERMFQPFTQVDGSSTRRYGGLGLGLTLTRSFCHLLGGEIEVESAVGVGSTFTVTLPRCPPRAPALLATAAEEEFPSLFPSLPSLAPRRSALIVDDDLESREALTVLLREAGFEADAFAEPEAAIAHLVEHTDHSGLTGLASLAVHRPALVVLDVQRADDSGFDALRRIAPLCPTLVLSTVHAEQRCRELGAVAFILRPATPDALRLQVARVARPL